jgi:hypothetical protein
MSDWRQYVSYRSTDRWVDDDDNLWGEIRTRWVLCMRFITKEDLLRSPRPPTSICILTERSPFAYSHKICVIASHDPDSREGASISTGRSIRGSSEHAAKGRAVRQTIVMIAMHSALQGALSQWRRGREWAEVSGIKWKFCKRQKVCLICSTLTHAATAVIGYAFLLYVRTLFHMTTLLDTAMLDGAFLFCDRSSWAEVFEADCYGFEHFRCL